MTEYDPRDVHSWSGLGLHILKCLEQQGFQVEPIGPIPWRSSPWAMYAGAKFVLYNYALREKWGHYSRYLEPSLVRFWGKEIQSRLENQPFDLIFSPHTQAVVYLETGIPIVIWTDATFSGLVESYGAGRPLCRENLDAGKAIESKALAKIRLGIFSSDWAAETAMKDYGLPREKTCVIPYGANLESAPDKNRVEQLIEGRSRDRIELLFIGVDYDRKGGACAVEIARQLNAAGVPARLTIVGCQPQIDHPFVEVLGFLSKSRPQDRERLESLLGRSHFLLLPTKADCSPIVLCEANSFGVPCITTRVGGISTTIRDGVNGRLFPPHPDPKEIAGWIAGIAADREGYRRLAMSSYQEYAERLNWTAAGKALGHALERVVGGKGSRLAPTLTTSG